METKQGTIKRRMSRIKGVCYIPGGDISYSYPVPSAEDTAEIVVPFISDGDGKTAAEKVNEIFARALKREAKLKASGGLSDSVKKDSAFAIARNGIKNLLEAMKKVNPHATMAQAGAAWMEIPGMRAQLEAEGVIFGEPDEKTLADVDGAEDDEEAEDDED